MQKLPVLSARKVLKARQKNGFEIVAQKGSHIRLKKITPKETRIVVVPNHPEVAKGTLLSILRQAGLTREEFMNLVDSN